jgi:hypothetical protein
LPGSRRQPFLDRYPPSDILDAQNHEKFVDTIIPRYANFFSFALVVLAGCDDSVRLEYSTKAEAESESLFARGWLPEIIPPSSRQITMKNDLDLNVSEGEFKFDATDHEAFIGKLERMQSLDVEGFSAYSFEDWTFFISGGRDQCRFRMRLSRD